MTRTTGAAAATRRTGRRLIWLLLAFGLAAGFTAIEARPAAAEPECLRPSYDLDSDGTLDPVIGMPGRPGGPGAVQVRISNEQSPLVRRLTGPYGFGSAVGQTSSYENEGDDPLCSVLLVGSPNETVAGLPNAGAVYAYSWQPAEQRFVLRGRYAPGVNGVPGSPQAGARFGAALGSQTRDIEEIDPRPHRIYVGAPGQDVAGHADAGRVFSFRLGAGDRPAAEDGTIIDLSTDGVPGSPTTGAAFGTAISAGHGMVAIGAPGQTAGGVRGAGAVLVAPDDRFSGFPPYLLSQAGAGFPGTPESGDQLGRAVAWSGRTDDATVRLLIGAPGEDLGDTADAGTVDVVPIAVADGRVAGGIAGWDQDTAGMAGTAEAGDRFGAAVTSLLEGDRLTGLVGTPGEDVGSVRDAGMVQRLGSGGWTQDSAGVPGSSETGDRMGAALAGSIIGVPGENGSAGVVIAGLPVGGATSQRWLAPTTDPVRYGAAVAP